MFDDISTNQAPPPGNLPLEPEDMFSGVDESAVPAPALAGGEPAQPPTTPNALGAGMLKKKMPDAPVTTPPPMQPPVQPQVSYAVKGPVIGKVLVVFFAGAAVVGVSLGVWWGYNRFIAKKTAVPVATDTTPATPVTTQPTTPVPSIPVTVTDPNAPASTNTVSTKIQNDQILFGETVDADKDGIDDQREKGVGTDLTVADTDGDGLSDGEEVLTWKTDPLSTDTDGDGYPDGQEVNNKYNPRGPGKLPTSP